MVRVGPRLVGAQRFQGDADAFEQRVMDSLLANAAMGSSRDARLAGYTPATMPDARADDHTQQDRERRHGGVSRRRHLQ